MGRNISDPNVQMLDTDTNTSQQNQIGVQIECDEDISDEEIDVASNKPHVDETGNLTASIRQDK